MKELQKLQKVKLKLIQPEIICGGRKRVTCIYKGEIIRENNEKYTVRFKYKKQFIVKDYLKESNQFVDLELKNIKLIAK